MIINKYKFKQQVPYKDKKSTWKIEDITFNDFNLIVGRNSTGKSKIINSIESLSKIISNRKPVNFFDKCEWELSLIRKEKNIEKTYNYLLKIDKNTIEKEILTINDKKVIERSKSGKGTILAEKISKKETEIEFQVPINEMVIFVKRDKIQHPYLEALFEWANNVKYYPFNQSVGKYEAAVFIEGYKEPNNIDIERSIYTFKKGIKEHGDNFKNAIKEDLAVIGYKAEYIDTSEPISVRMQIMSPVGNFGKPIFLCIKEDDIDIPTDQHAMSDGMYRALSLIIQINYLILNNKPCLVLIDDIGEGLDYGRSCSLVELLIQKSRKHSIQCITSSNDRFVMNAVPLESWIYLKRAKNGPKIYSIHNSKEKFDDFKYTGLSNFDFLATNFIENEE